MGATIIGSGVSFASNRAQTRARFRGNLDRRRAFPRPAIKSRQDRYFPVSEGLQVIRRAVCFFEVCRDVQNGSFEMLASRRRQ